MELRFGGGTNVVVIAAVGSSPRVAEGFSCADNDKPNLRFCDLQHGTHVLDARRGA